MNRLALFISLVLVSSTAGANPHAQGWRWYNEFKPHPEPPLTPRPALPQGAIVITQSPPTPRVLTATEQMDGFQRYMKEVQTQAVITPTLDKVLAFMRLNQFIDGKTTDFGMMWKQALLADPTLSYTVRHPTQSLAKQTQNAALIARRTAAVKALAGQGYGLFFVYNGKEVLNQQLAPSLQSFAHQYGIGLLGITLDNTLIETIEHNRVNDGKLKVAAQLALLLVNPNTGHIKPLAYGFISQEELLGRFLNAATHFEPDF